MTTPRWPSREQLLNGWADIALNAALPLAAEPVGGRDCRLGNPGPQLLARYAFPQEQIRRWLCGWRRDEFSGYRGSRGI